MAEKYSMFLWSMIMWMESSCYNHIINYLMFYKSLYHVEHVMWFISFLTHYLLCFAITSCSLSQCLTSSRGFLISCIIISLRMLHVFFIIITTNFIQLVSLQPVDHFYKLSCTIKPQVMAICTYVRYIKVTIDYWDIRLSIICQVHSSRKHISVVHSLSTNKACLLWWLPYLQHTSWWWCNHLGILSSMTEILLWLSLPWWCYIPISVSTLKPPLRAIGVISLEPWASPIVGIGI